MHKYKYPTKLNTKIIDFFITIKDHPKKNNIYFQVLYFFNYRKH